MAKTYINKKMVAVSIEPDSYLIVHDRIKQRVFTGDTIIKIFEIENRKEFFNMEFLKLEKNNYHQRDIENGIKVTEDELIRFVNYFNPFNRHRRQKKLMCDFPEIGEKVLSLSHSYSGIIVDAKNVLFVDIQWKNRIEKNVPVYMLEIEDSLRKVRKYKMNEIINMKK